MTLESRLPELAGGWARQSLEISSDLEVELFVPAAPDELLDDDAVVARNEFNDSMPYWAWLWDSAPTMARRIAAAGEREAVYVAGLVEVGAHADA